MKQIVIIVLPQKVNNINLAGLSREHIPQNRNRILDGTDNFNRVYESDMDGVRK